VTGEPRSLSALIAWYRDEVDATIPQRIHSRDTAEDGDPEWHSAFRRWLTAHPAAEDRDGQLLSPLRYWLWRVECLEAKSNGRRATFLANLAYLDFDWKRAAVYAGVLDHGAAHDYAVASLRRLWLLMYVVNKDARGVPVTVPTEPARPKLGECAEPGCRARTVRLRCTDHALGT